MNLYIFNPELCPSTSSVGHEGYGCNSMGNQDPLSYSYCNDFGLLDPVDGWHSNATNVNLCAPNTNELPRQVPLDGDPNEVPDIPDTCFNYISNLLREEDLDDRPGATLQDYMAAQLSYNKSLDAALLGETSSFIANQCNPAPPSFHNPPVCYDEYFNRLSTNPSTSNAANDSIINFVENRFVGHSTGPCSSSGSSNDIEPTLIGNLPVDGLIESPSCVFTRGVQSNHSDQALNAILDGNWEFINSAATASDSIVMHREQTGDDLPDVQRGGNYPQWDKNIYASTQIEPTLLQNPISQIGIISSNCPSNRYQAPINMPAVTAQDVNQPTDKTRGRKHCEGDEGEAREETRRSNKQSAPSIEVFDQIEKYGDVLLCPEGRSKPGALCHSGNQKLQKDGNSSKNTSSKGSKKRGIKVQIVVDLKGLLTRCAQCVARVDLTGAYEILKQIRQHSSPYGDSLQRVAHYLGNALEARLEGKGGDLVRSNEQVPATDVLKANRVYVASVPFKIMSYYTTNKTIGKLAEGASSIHIIDFGIHYGLQWPCIIQNLAKVPNGPPRLRITGIDLPQRGFRPAERVEETGRCLAKHCEKYNVPFEYYSIAKKWEDIKLEDLNINRNEPLVVNCLYRSHNLYDESVDETSPRDAFLSLVRKINPDIFMHGVVNSTSSVPFFLNRFKEALFHYTALFDLFEATMGREDNERMLLESKLYGNQAMNVIACEGMERVERPETYKQWQVRTQRAGFVQVPLDRELVRRARAMVRRSFREEFSYDEDGLWVIQGWKGRILYAISCWKPQDV